MMGALCIDPGWAVPYTRGAFEDVAPMGAMPTAASAGLPASCIFTMPANIQFTSGTTGAQRGDADQHNILTTATSSPGALR